MSKDLGDLVFVDGEHPAYLVLNHESPPGTVYVQWATRGDRGYVANEAIQQMTSRRGRRALAPPPPPPPAKNRAVKTQARAKSTAGETKTELRVGKTTKTTIAKKTASKKAMKNSQGHDENRSIAEDTGSLEDIVEAPMGKTSQRHGKQLDAKNQAGEDDDKELEQSEAVEEEEEEVERTEAPLEKEVNDETAEINSVEEEKKQSAEEMVAEDEVKEPRASLVQEAKEPEASLVQETQDREIQQPEPPLAQDAMHPEAPSLQEARKPDAQPTQKTVQSGRSQTNGSTEPRRKLVVNLSSDDEDDDDDDDAEEAPKADEFIDVKNPTSKMAAAAGPTSQVANDNGTKKRNFDSTSEEKKISSQEYFASGETSPAPPRIQEPDSVSRDDMVIRKVKKRRRPMSLSEEAKESHKEDDIFACARKSFVKSNKNSTTVGQIIRSVEAELGVSFGPDTKQRIQKFLRQLALSWKYNESRDNGHATGLSHAPLSPTRGRIDPPQNGFNQQTDA